MAKHTPIAQVFAWLGLCVRIDAENPEAARRIRRGSGLVP